MPEARLASMARPITLLSDYGYRDEFAGVCRAVIARAAPDAHVIDLTHGVPRHAVRQAAFVLANALPYAPAGVHVAVVDPGVGTQRRAIAAAVQDEDRVMVGPDNGVLWPALERFGGAVEAVDVSRSPLRLEPLSATFHGRDVFAPVAARLAAGASLSEAGERVAPASLTELQLPRPSRDGSRVEAEVLYVDGFGNAVLAAAGEDLAGTGLRPGEPLRIQREGASWDAVFGRTFADAGAGSLLLYEDSSRALALAVNRGSASAALSIKAGDHVTLAPP